MNRKKRRDGYSDEGLQALERGTYGKETGRQAKYNTSKEQLRQVHELPKLEGMRAVPLESTTVPKSQSRQSDVGENHFARSKKQQASVIKSDEGPGFSQDFIKSNLVPNLKPSTRYQNETVAQTMPELPTYDKTYEKDFEDFFNWRYNQADVRDYDPATDTETEHWRNVQKDIMNKYGWTEKEFNQKYGEYDNYRLQKMRNEELSGNLALAEKHPLFGTAASYLYNLESIGEGFDTALRGVLGEKNYNKLFDTINPYNRNRSNVATLSREGMRQNAKKKLNGFGQFGYDLATGAGDMLVNSALGGGTSAGMGIVSGAQTAASTEQHAKERGIDDDMASRTGLASGIISGLLNGVGLDVVLKSGGKTALEAIGKAAAREGLENVSEDFANMAADIAINKDKSEVSSTFSYYLNQGMSPIEAINNTYKDYLKQEATSFGSGALFGGLIGTGKNLPWLAKDIEDYSIYKSGKKMQKEIQKIKDGMTADQVIQELEGKKPQLSIPEVITNNVEVPEYPTINKAPTPVEVDPANVIYHSGTLGRLNKSETRGKMHDGSRNTGYFGTGHYFVDNAHRGEIDNNSNYNVKPYTSVDISKYGNLYKADTDAKAEKLHGFSEDYTRYVNTHNDSKYYTDADGHIDEEARAEYLDDLYETFRELFPEQPTTKEQFINQINAFRESEYDVGLLDRDDSVFTQLMKSMGYNGVDTTGTRFADTRYGTVIYDLDEDSILQSNVTDAEVKKGLMNTRVRNEGQDVFDTAEDEKIQKSLDAVSKRRAIGEEYRKLFDEPSFRQLKAELEETKKYLDRSRESLEEDTYTLNNPDAFAEKVEEHKRTLKKYHLESETDEEAIQNVRYELENGIEDTKELIAQREQRVKELQASVDDAEKASKAAYEQAVRIVDGIPDEDINNAVAESVAEEIQAPKEVPDLAALTQEIEAKRAELNEIPKEQKAERQARRDELQALQNQAKAAITGKGSTSAPKNEVPSVKSPIESDQERLDNLINSRKSESVELDNGQTIEKYSMKEMKDIVKEVKENGLPDGEQLYIVYKDGTEVAYSSGDDTSDIRLNNIDSVVWYNESTDAFAGNNISIYPDLTNSPNGNDVYWRVAVGQVPDSYYQQEVPSSVNNVPEVVNRVNTNIASDTGVERNPSITVNPPSNGPINPSINGPVPNGPAPEGPNGPNNPPVNSSSPKGPEYKDSALIKDTARNADIISNYEYENDTDIAAIKKYEVSHNSDTLSKAIDNVQKHGTSIFDQYRDGKEVSSPQDIDEAILIMRSLKAQMDNTLDPELKQELTAKRNLMLSRLREATTPRAQFLQALAKWNGTPEGLEWNAVKILNDSTKIAMKRDKTQKENNRIIAEALSRIGNNGETEPTKKIPLTHEELRQSIIDTFTSDEYASIGEQLNDTDIEYLTWLAENKDIPVWKITDELEHRLTHGKWYTLDESTPIVAEKSNRLAKLLDAAVGGKQLVKEPKTPESLSKTIEKVRNTLAEDYVGFADNFNENDVEFIATMFQEGVPSWQIEDELRHKMEFGEWYTLDESTPVVAEKSNKITSILNEAVGEGKAKKAAKEPETYTQKIEKIKNALDSEDASIAGQFNDSDYDFINTMFENNVPRWQIVDEFRHKLETGDWYTLDESIEAKRTPTNPTLNAALKQFRSDELIPESATSELTTDQIAEQVRNTLAKKEFAGFKGQLNDEEINFIANLIKSGATSGELASLLDMKVKKGKFKVPEKTMATVNELLRMRDYYGYNSKKGIQYELEAYRLIANEVVDDADAFQKFEAWRYLAMLGNAKTVIRNQVGNKVSGAVTGVSNNIAAGAESFIDWALKKAGKEGIKNRRKAILNPVKDKDLISGAWKDGDLNRAREIMGSKYEKSSVRDRIKASKSVFDSKLLQLYEKATDLGVSDALDVQTKYSTSLAGFMKANGLTADAFDAGERYKQLRKDSMTRVLTDAEKAEMSRLKDLDDLMEIGRDYAIKQAEYATFHEDNVVAKWISNAASSARESGNPALNLLGTVIEGTVPFKKTPANIFRTGVEYSPLGIIKSIIDTGKLVYENTGSRKTDLDDIYSKKIPFTDKYADIHRSIASDVIESWSKSFTGSMLTVLGYWLAGKGIIHVSSDDEKYQDELEGKQNFSMIVNGKSRTIDWLAPGAMPLLLGAELRRQHDENLVLNEKFYKNPDKILRSINQLLNPLVETSYLQGVQNLLESASRQYQNGQGNGTDVGLSLIGNAATNYLTQGIPTLSGQLARTIDPYRRSTDTATEGWVGELERTARKTANKIPGLSFINEPYINARGEKQFNSPFDIDTGGKLPGFFPVLGNLMYQTMAPYYVSDVNETLADKSAREAYNGRDAKLKPIRNKNVFQAWDSKVDVNGEKLNPKQMTTYRKLMGKSNTKIRTALELSDWFKELPAKDRTEILTSVNTLSKKIGKRVFDSSVTGDDLDAYANGGVQGVLDYFRQKTVKSQVKEQTGLNSNSKAVTEITQDIMSGDTESANQKISEVLQQKEAVKPYEDLANELGTDATTVSQVANYAGDNWAEVEPELPVLKEMGLSNYSQYAHAVNYASTKGENISTQWFVDQTKLLDTDKSGGVNQDELKNYFNANKLSEEEVMRLWGMFALGKDGAETKAVPYIITRGDNKGKWGYK